MDNREAAEMMRCTPTEDDQIGHNNNTTDAIEIQISRGTSMSVSDSPSSSSYARSDDHVGITPPTTANNNLVIRKKLVAELRTIACSCCGHHIPLHHQADILNDLPEMPAGVKFDPSDIEILEHLDAKVQSDSRKLHPLIDEFIRTLEGDNGICYTHPENLPGVSKDGQIRHFFHRPSKAYTTGNRKRRKVHTDEDVDGSGSTGETRWHKTGKTRAVVDNGIVKGFKKILVLYTNYGRQRKPEKTNWVMHQYHLGHSEEEKDGELVLSKVFYQTQARHSAVPQPTLLQPAIEYPQHQLQVGSSSSAAHMNLEYYHRQQPRLVSFGHEHYQGREMSIVPHMIPDSGMQLGDRDDRDQSREKTEADRRANNE